MTSRSSESGEPVDPAPRDALQEWYLESLTPKLLDALDRGTIARAAVAALDRDVRVMLELPHDGAPAAS
jgi:hypothetical protein